jgi:hypothetical protein
MTPILRNQVADQLAAANQDPKALQAMLGEKPLPPDLSQWLGRLRVLYGVPIQYLVPDEGMLPPESIRFFYLDNNWIDALIDGAFSIGRNLTNDRNNPSLNRDRAVAPKSKEHAEAASAAIRARALGVTPPPITFGVVTGFLLRSALVGNYPGLGVNTYAYGSTPKDPKPTRLDIVRMERLGPKADTLICLVAGDIYQADIHEAPEALHYGIDRFGPTKASKSIHLFTKTGSTVTMSDTLVDLNLFQNDCFRTQNNGVATVPTRTIKMATLAALIAASQVPPIAEVDSAEMGFEMTEGVGMVSFFKKIS